MQDLYQQHRLVSSSRAFLPHFSLHLQLVVGAGIPVPHFSRGCLHQQHGIRSAAAEVVVSMYADFDLLLNSLIIHSMSGSCVGFRAHRVQAV